MGKKKSDAILGPTRWRVEKGKVGKKGELHRKRKGRSLEENKPKRKD